MSSATRRYSLLLGSAILSAQPLTATAEADRCDGQPVRFTAVWYDIVEHFPDGGAGAAEELRRRFCEIGVNTAWRRARPGDLYGVGPRPEIPVAILETHPLQSRVPRPIMGEVPEHWTSPEPRPVRVYVDGIREALGIARFGGAAETSMRLAVGRVATHEMVHALAPSQGHARDGLMSARLGRRALVGAPPPMAAGHVSAVHAALHVGGPRLPVSVAERVRVPPLLGGPAPSRGGAPFRP